MGKVKAIKVHKSKAKPGISFWDVESPRGWDRPEMVCTYDETGATETFRGNTCMEQMRAHAEKKRGTFIAHYGGGYDTLLMLNVWPMAELHLTGSSVMCAKDARDLEFRDSFPWWLSPLKKVGKAVGLEKLDVDRARMHLLTEAETERYCIRDCEIGMRGTEAANQFLDERGAKRAWTAGSSAVSLVRAMEPGSWASLKRMRVDAEMAREMLTTANNGARVESWARGEVSPVYCYDVKSSYPARYVNQPVGIGLRRAVPGDKWGIWLCRWRWKERDRVPVALDRGTMAGVGECQSWLIDAEIQAFEECGVNVERVEGWAPEEMADIGQDFVAEMYRAKEESGIGSFFAKVWLNSWHGKLMMRPIRERFTRWRPDRWWGPIPPSPVGLCDDPNDVGDRGEPLWWRYFSLEVSDDGKLRPFQQPIAGAHILGRARVALWRIVDAVNRAGFRIYYSDTDSLHCSAPPAAMARILGPDAMGTGLGQLNYEGGPFEGVYLGPKAYLLINEKGEVEKQALKGVPLKAYADCVKEGGVYRAARGEEKGTDMRRDVFWDALHDGARCKKQGLQSFLRGIAQSSEDDRPRWKETDETPRTIRPTTRGKIANAAGFAYLSSLEVSARDIARGISARGKIPEGEESAWLRSRGFISADALSAEGNKWLDLVDGKMALAPAPELKISDVPIVKRKSPALPAARKKRRG